MREMTVRNAVRQGKGDVVVPYYLAIFTTHMILVILYGFQIAPWWLCLSLSPFCFGIAVYVKAIYMYKWQAWASAQVRDIQQLKVVAKYEGLSNEWIESIFPPPRELKQRLTAFQAIAPPEEFNFVDNPEIPETVAIYYSLSYNRYQLLGWGSMFLFITWATATLYNTGELQDRLWLTIFLGFLCLVSLLSTIENIFQLRDKNPQLVFSAKGIKLKKKFIDKHQIKDVRIFLGKEKTILISMHGLPIDWVEEISDFDVDHKKLEATVQVFKDRWTSSLLQTGTTYQKVS
jgi:hypothetical protein